MEDDQRRRRRERFGGMYADEEPESGRRHRGRGQRSYRDHSPTRDGVLSDRWRRDRHDETEAPVRSRLAPVVITGESAWSDPRANKHVLQAQHDRVINMGSRLDIPFSRQLLVEAPRMKYRRRRDDVKSVVNWKARSQLLAVTEFLLRNGALADTVVMLLPVSAHLPILCQMFPHHRFIVYDTAPMPLELGDVALLEWREQAFSDESVAEFASLPILLVSECRIVEEEDAQFQMIVHMKMQKEWCDSIKPAAALLRFGLPWNDLITSYLSGEMFLPIWSPATGTEVYLSVTNGGDALVQYDNRAHEEQMFYFNNVTRVALYPHEVTGVPGLDHCFDCASEVAVLTEFATRNFELVLSILHRMDVGAYDETKPVSEIVAGLSKAISESLAPGSSLSEPGRRRRARSKPAVKPDVQSIQEPFVSAPPSEEPSRRNSTDNIEADDDDEMDYMQDKLEQVERFGFV